TVMASRRHFPPGWSVDEDSELFGLIRKEPPNHTLSPRLRQQVEQTLAELGNALQASRNLMRRTRGRFPSRAGRVNRDPEFREEKHSANLVLLWLFDAIRHADRGAVKTALTSARAAWNAARSVGDDPVGYPQGLRAVGVEAVAWTIQRILAH